MSAYPVFIHHLFVAALDRNARLKSEDGRPGATAKGQTARQRQSPAVTGGSRFITSASHNFNGPGPHEHE